MLDAGCGGGRVAGYLHAVGHDVVGVDVDPVLVQAAEADYPGPRWVVADLADLDLAAHGIPQRFDAIVCAGNVLTFCAPSPRRDVLDRFAAHLASDGRIVVGFGTDRGYPVAEFLDDVAAVGLVAELLLSTWDLRPYAADADFLVALLRRG